jgi:hypothetical protein
MSSAVSNATVVNLFKKKYGEISNLVPQGFPFSEMVKYNQKQKIGESYNEAVILTSENGWTLGGSAGDVFEINPAKAGAVKQATINAYVTVLNSIVPWSVLSRSAGGGEEAFVDGTKHIVGNNLKSHMKLLEIMSLYGQSADLLGYVSYATATYRGVSLTTGTGTVGGVAFTNGVNTSSKAIMMAPGSFAAGIWVGSEGATVHQVNSSGVIVASGELLSIDSDNGILYVDFTPVVASSTTSHRLCFDGMQLTNDMIGVNKIMTNTGTLFGISAATSGGYSLWRASQTTLTAQLLTFDRLQIAAANATNRGGLDQDLTVMVNPRSFAKMINAEAARRQYDDSYKSSEFDNGAKEITFYYAGGSMKVVANRYVKEGEAYGFVQDTWVRSGSAQISLKVPGIDKEIVFPLENSSAFCFRSYSDQYIFCRAPARNFYISGINDEAAS